MFGVKSILLSKFSSRSADRPLCASSFSNLSIWLAGMNTEDPLRAARLRSFKKLRAEETLLMVNVSGISGSPATSFETLRCNHGSEI